MSLQQTIVDGALKAVAKFHPELAPLIKLVIQYEPQIEKAIPVVQAAIEEGGSAYAAAEKAAPELAAAIKGFVASIPGTAATPAHAAAITTKHAENVTRELVGFHTMTPAEELDWMNRSSASSAGA